MSSERIGSLTKILFVDDEEALLAGLQNVLRRQRRIWEMTFALGPTAALEALATQRFDLVVTDMRMPGMDGAALLERVRAAQPGALRIVLSGQAEREAVLKGMTVAHQFIGKPCGPDTLKAVIERAASSRMTLTSSALRELVGGIGVLPSAPSVVRALADVVRRPDAGVEEVARIIARDQGMSAKVLQLANSAFLGCGRPLCSVAQAVGLLGVEIVRSLTLSVGVFDARRPFDSAAETGSEGESEAAQALERLQRQAHETALIAKALLPAAQRDLAFTAGLMYSIGALIRATANGALCSADESGATDAELGAYLLGIWGLPASIVAAIGYHYEGPPLRPDEPLDVPRAVLVADRLVRALAAPAAESTRTSFESLLASDHRETWLALARRALDLGESAK